MCYMFVILRIMLVQDTQVPPGPAGSPAETGAQGPVRDPGISGLPGTPGFTCNSGLPREKGCYANIQ